MKQIFAALLCMSLFGCGAAARPDKIEMIYFYDGACASCDKLSVFHEQLAAELEGVSDRFTYEVIPVNIFSAEGSEKEAAFFKKLGMDEAARAALSYPILAIGGEILSGDEEIQKSLREAFVKAGESLSH